MLRFARTVQAAVVLLLIGSLLAACRVTEVPPTVYPAPGVANYPGPLPQATARPAATRPPTRPPTASSAPAVTATPAGAGSTAPVGAVDLTLTLLHTGDVQGEVVPCG